MSNRAALAPAEPRVTPLPTSTPSAPVSLILVVSALLFGLMAVVTKMSAARVPGPQVAFVRFCVGLLACAVAATRMRLRARNKAGLFLRGLYGGAAVLLYFLGIQHLPVGVATLLNYTAPVFTAMYAAVFLRESIKPATLGALGITTLGVGLVMKASAPPGTLGLGVWQISAIASAVLSGAAVATIRDVRRTDGSWEIFTAFCLGGALITVVPTVASWVPPSPLEWGGMVAVGLLSLLAQLMMTYALRFVRSAVAGVIAQLAPVAALAMGWSFLHESIAGLALFGALITLAGVSWGAFQASAPELVTSDPEASR